MAEELIEFTRTGQVLMQLAEEVRMGYIKNLVRSGHPTYFGTGRLTDTITANVTVDGHSFSATLRMNKYWEYLEEGTGPARGRDKYWPNSSAIAKWVEIKPVIPRPDSNKKIPTPKQLAFLISRKIHDKGIKGTHDLERAKEEVIPHYYALIEEALTADIGDYLWKMIAW
jgi:hypothetical protein